MDKSRWNTYKRNRHRMLREKILEKIGNKCIFCGGGDRYIKTPRRELGYLHFHEIHGNDHNIHMKYILDHSENFVPVCPRCHRGIHFMMTYLGYNWNDIILRLRSVK